MGIVRAFYRQISVEGKKKMWRDTMWGSEIIGPFNQGEYYMLAVDGYKVPYLYAQLRKGTEDIWDVFLDNRWAYELTDRELHKVLPLLANAMAVAAGYSCHGKNSQRTNPFGTQMMGIDGIRSDE